MLFVTQKSSTNTTVYRSTPMKEHSNG